MDRDKERDLSFFSSCFVVSLPEGPLLKDHTSFKMSCAKFIVHSVLNHIPMYMHYKPQNHVQQFTDQPQNTSEVFQ